MRYPSIRQNTPHETSLTEIEKLSTTLPAVEEGQAQIKALRCVAIGTIHRLLVTTQEELPLAFARENPATKIRKVVFSARYITQAGLQTVRRHTTRRRIFFESNSKKIYPEPYLPPWHG